MNSGRHVLAQILDLVHRETLSRLVSKYNAGRRNFYSVKVENYFWGRSAGFMLR